MPPNKAVGHDYFFVWRDPLNPQRVEVQVDFRGKKPGEVPADERLIYANLRTSQVLVNQYLRYLGVGGKHAPGSLYEYAKVLRYALEYLALSPKNMYGDSVPASLPRLGHGDVVSMLAWLCIPTSKVRARLLFAKTGDPQPEMREYPVSDRTRNLRETCLHAFYDWLMTVGLEGIPKPASNPVKTAKLGQAARTERARKVPEGVRVPEPDRGLRRAETRGVTILEPDEFRLVIESIPAVSGHTRNQALRDELIVRVMTHACMRPSELPLWHWSGIDLQKGTFEIPTVKNRQLQTEPRIGTLNDVIRRLLMAYTGEMPIPASHARSGFVIRNVFDESRPVTKRAVDELFRRLVAHFRSQAELLLDRGDTQGAAQAKQLAEKLHPHIFRKTGATYWAASGLPIQYLAKMLGHRDPSTTMKYYVAAERLNLAQRLMELIPQVQQRLEGVQAPKPGLNEANAMLARFGIRGQEVGRR